MAGAVRRVEQAMAAGSLAFAAGGLLAPRVFGRLSGLSPATARLLGVRDLAIAVVLLGRGGPLGLVVRGLSDVGDAVVLARRRPALAAFAGTAACVSLLAALDARRSPRRPTSGSAARPGAAWRGTPVG